MRFDTDSLRALSECSAGLEHRYHKAWGWLASRIFRLLAIHMTDTIFQYHFLIFLAHRFLLTWYVCAKILLSWIWEQCVEQQSLRHLLSIPTHTFLLCFFVSYSMCHIYDMVLYLYMCQPLSREGTGTQKSSREVETEDLGLSWSQTPIQMEGDILVTAFGLYDSQSYIQNGMTISA